MKLTIVSLNKEIYQGDVTAVFAKSPQGAFEIRPGHAHFLAELVESDLYYETDANVREGIFISGGVLEARPDEVIIAIETGDIDYAESRMNSLIRRYGVYLKAQPQSHIIRFLKLVRYYCRYPEEVTSEKFATKVDTTIKWKPSEQEDLFLMTIFAWLKSKMQKKNLYKVVLKLVSNSSKKNN